MTAPDTERDAGFRFDPLTMKPRTIAEMQIVKRFGTEPDDEFDADAVFPDETDEAWDYMVDLLDDDGINVADFRRQMIESGYSDEVVEQAIAECTGEI